MPKMIIDKTSHNAILLPLVVFFLQRINRFRLTYLSLFRNRPHVLLVYNGTVVVIAVALKNLKLRLVV